MCERKTTRESVVILLRLHFWFTKEIGGTKETHQDDSSQDNKDKTSNQKVTKTWLIVRLRCEGGLAVGKNLVGIVCVDVCAFWGSWTILGCMCALGLPAFLSLFRIYVHGVMGVVTMDPLPNWVPETLTSAKLKVVRVS